MDGLDPGGSKEDAVVAEYILVPVTIKTVIIVNPFENDYRKTKRVTGT